MKRDLLSSKPSNVVPPNRHVFDTGKVQVGRFYEVPPDPMGRHAELLQAALLDKPKPTVWQRLLHWLWG